MNIKNTLKSLSLFFFGLAAVSCSDNTPGEPEESTKETMLKSAAQAYVSHTVLPTYKGMADAAIELYDNCEIISQHHAAGALTTADIAAAANAWKESRRYWELSEAFLFGPAADYNIDPHIDSWPLDKAAMDRLLAELRKGAELTLDNNFGDGRTSNYHSLNYTPEEITYLLMVAEDLRNQCVCLEACWAGTPNISSEKQDILDEADLDKGKDHGWMMANAGQAGSIYKTYQEVAEEIIQGCIDIADEVGNTKIGRPHNGSSLDDRNYIESPYSLNSIEDFQDNIRSIKNSYCGSVAGDPSISDYVRSVNPALDSEMRAAIDNAISAIAAIPEPFALNAAGAEAANAVEVVGDNLVATLEKVYSELSKQ